MAKVLLAIAASSELKSLDSAIQTESDTVLSDPVADTRSQKPEQLASDRVLERTSTSRSSITELQ